MRGFPIRVAKGEEKLDVSEDIPLLKFTENSGHKSLLKRHRPRGGKTYRLE